MISNGPIQSSDQLSGITSVVASVGASTDLYCDIYGNRGCMLGPYWGIFFSKDGITLAITALTEYEYNPTQWAFIDPLTKDIAAIFLSLDAISGKRKEFASPGVQVILVEDVYSFLKNGVIPEWTQRTTDNHYVDSNTITEAIIKLTKSMEKSLYQPIPTVADYAS